MGKVAITLSAEAAGLEDQLRATLVATADEVAHAECFDEEQRAEVYSILHALKSDSERHLRWVGQWVGQAKKEVADA